MTRSTKTTTATPVTPTIAVKRTARGTKPSGLDQTHAANVEQDDESVMRSYFDKLKADFKLSWTRERVVAMVLGLVVGAASGYVAMSLVAMVTAAVASATSSMFLMLIVYVIGALLAMYASGVLGTVVYEYIACGAAREHVSLVASTVRGWFTPRRLA